MCWFNKEKDVTNIFCRKNYRYFVISGERQIRKETLYLNIQI